MVRYPLIVARTQPDLWHYLKNNFSGDDKVEVILDRRRGERRQRVQPRETERRRVERRRQRSIDHDLSYRSFAIVRQPQGALLPSGKDGVTSRVLHHPHRRLSAKILRPPQGPLEIRLSGLVGAAERRVRRWRVAVAVLLVGLVAGASFAVAVFALRWDYQRGQTLQLLHADLEVAQARARCWEALARYLPESPKDVIPDSRRGGWVRQCLATELARFNPKR